MATHVLPRTELESPDAKIMLSGDATSRLVIADGTLEALKWFAFALMVADHVNKYFFNEEIPGIFQLGRIVMPVFGFILVYNLSRPHALERGVFRRVMIRLALVGGLSIPICVMLNATVVTRYPWWPFNILFTLLLVTAITSLIELGGWPRKILATALFLLVSPFIEYAWMGVLTCLGAWAFCREPTYKHFLWWFLGALSLTVINGNAWALLALPLILVGRRFQFRVTRYRWAFYLLYPAHLLSLLALKL